MRTWQAARAGLALATTLSACGGGDSAEESWKVVAAGVPNG